jgi:hypothetical protein
MAPRPLAKPPEVCQEETRSLTYLSSNRISGPENFDQQWKTTFATKSVKNRISRERLHVSYRQLRTYQRAHPQRLGVEPERTSMCSDPPAPDVTALLVLHRFHRGHRFANAAPTFVEFTDFGVGSRKTVTTRPASTSMFPSIALR